jgi:superfamily II DNA or RNA helicase
MSTFTEFLNSFDPDSKGKEFESFVKWFLKNDPEWSTQVDQVWLWDEYPERWGRDCGIDLIFKHKNGDVWAVQAKCYSPEYSITKTDVDKFLSESNRKGVDRRLLIASTDQIGANAKQVCNAQEKSVTHFLFSDFDKSAIEYPSNLSELNTAKRKERPSSRPHQAEAIDAVEKGFKESDRGQLIMACGTGKTFTTLWIKERISAETTLVLVPSLSLLSQTLREWTFACNTPFDVLCVCSDQSVGKRSNEDEIIQSVNDVPFPVTSDVQEIGDFIKGNGHKVIFSTYQSSPLIEESQSNPEVPTFDLVIADEAHRCVGKVDSEFATVLDDRKIRSKKRLFATATPRTYSVSLKKSASERGVDVFGMDDEEVFGNEFYILAFGEAIERDLLTDYQVVIVGVDDPMIAEYIERRELVKTESGDITDAESLASQIGLIKAIKDYDLKRMISFHGRVKRAEIFASGIKSSIDFLNEDHRPNDSIWTDYVSGKMSSHQRRIKLEQLKELTKGNRGLLSNAKCLSEGVDVPSLDGVAFVDPKSSQVDIVQAVGRAIRLSGDKKIGTIVLSVFIKDGENAEASIEASNFKPIWSVLNALKAHDGVLSYELDQLRTDLGKRKSLGNGSDGMPKIIFDLPLTVNQSFSNSLKTYLVEKTTSSWNFWFGLLEAYSGQEGHSRVPQRFKTEEGYGLGSWVVNQRIHKNRLTPDQMEKLKSLPKWSWDPHADYWEEAFLYLEQFVEKEGHARVIRSHKLSNGFELGVWIARQRLNREQLTPDQVTKLESLPKWSWDAISDRWNDSYSYLVQYIKKEGNSRVPQNFRVEGGFNLGNWVSIQRRDRFNGSYDKSRIKKLEALPDWTWDPIEDRWNEGFSNLVQYVEKKGHARVTKRFETKDGFKLGQWVGVQRRDRDTNTYDQDRIKKLEALPAWTWDPNKDDWEEGYSYLLQFVEKEGHARVPANFRTMDGFSLGSWVANRRQGKKNNILTSTQIDKLEELEGWEWDPTEIAWEKGFSCLVQFIDQKGHARPPQLFKTESGVSLGQWVSGQRRNKNKLTLDQVKRLEELSKWTWDPKKDDWEEWFSFLVLFVEQEGNARPPQLFKTESGFSLGQWVSGQRRKKDTLTQDQVQRLESLKGWVWKMRK